MLGPGKLCAVGGPLGRALGSLNVGNVTSHVELLLDDDVSVGRASEDESGKVMGGGT